VQCTSPMPGPAPKMMRVRVILVCFDAVRADSFEELLKKEDAIVLLLCCLRLWIASGHEAASL
jgi:hypothetical protein